MVLVALPEEQVREIMAARRRRQRSTSKHKTVTAGGKSYPFEIDDEIRHRLLNGLDDISVTLQDEDAISRYEAEREREGPVTTALR